MTSKVNTKRAKLVKAKVKTAKVNKPVVKQVKPPVVKSKPVNSVVDVFIYPNKGLDEIDTVRLTINDHSKAFTALSKAKIDIMSLSMHKLVKALFVELQGANPSKFMFGIKRVYNFGFGLVPKGFNSYKSCITHHNTDGKVCLVLNANKHFGLGEIKSALVKHDVVRETYKTYFKVSLSEKNLPNVVKACQSLVEVSNIG